MTMATQGQALSNGGEAGLAQRPDPGLEPWFRSGMI